MKLFSPIWAFILFILPNPLVAQECTEEPTEVRDVSANLGAIRDQDSVGYCYAYAGADLLEDYLKRHGRLDEGQSVSALALSLNYDKQEWGKNLKDFREIAAYKERINSHLERISSEMERLRSQRSALYDKYKQVTRSYAESHPLYPEVLTLEKRVEEQEGEEREKLFEKLIETKRLIVEDLKRRNDEFRNYDRETREEANLINEEIESLQLTISMNEELFESPIIPEGGLTQEAIETSWPRICSESEVSSRDIGIQKVYENHRELYTASALFTGETLEDALGYMHTYWNDEGRQCSVYRLGQAVFSEFPFDNYTEFTRFLDGLDGEAYFFGEMLKRTCSPVTQMNRPIIKSEEGSVGDRIVLDTVDEGLKNNRPVNIDFHSHILEQKGFDPEIKDDRHASVIVGSFNKCGEQYYRLRNSWGEDSCERDRFEMLGDSAQVELNKCVRDSTVEMVFCEESDEKCLMQEELKQSEIKSECGEKVKSGAPYYCENGEYVIKKSYLRQGVYRATYITN